MLTQASKAKQDGTNSIGKRPSCVVLQLFVCVFSAFKFYMRADAILKADSNNVRVVIATN